LGAVPDVADMYRNGVVRSLLPQDWAGSSASEMLLERGNGKKSKNSSRN
jgi:hypothetical protein